MPGQFRGIHEGYVDGDLVFYADRFNGTTNDGEFEVEGTFFTRNNGQSTTYQLGALNRGIAVDENATGSGFIMFSEESVHTRFAANSPNPNNSDHLIAVQNSGGEWFYNNNDNVDSWIPFTPVESDTLLASVDFTNDTAAPLQGIAVRVVSGNATDATYDVFVDGATAPTESIQRDQQSISPATNDPWVRLGDFSVEGTLRVQLSDDADGYVVADAMMLERVSCGRQWRFRICRNGRWLERC